MMRNIVQNYENVVKSVRLLDTVRPLGSLSYSCQLIVLNVPPASAL